MYFTSRPFKTKMIFCCVAVLISCNGAVFWIFVFKNMQLIMRISITLFNSCSCHTITLYRIKSVARTKPNRETKDFSRCACNLRPMETSINRSATAHSTSHFNHSKQVLAKKGRSTLQKYLGHCRDALLKVSRRCSPRLKRLSQERPTFFLIGQIITNLRTLSGHKSTYRKYTLDFRTFL